MSDLMVQPCSIRDTRNYHSSRPWGRAVFVTGAKQGLFLRASELHYVLTYLEGVQTIICVHGELH